MVRGSDLNIEVLARGEPSLAPTITIRMDRFLDAWVAFIAWHRNRPEGDDLVPPFPPAEISIPPDDDDPGPATTL